MAEGVRPARVPPGQGAGQASEQETGQAPDGAGGRPLRADAARNREKVLRAAREAFAESGYGVPLDEIAARAGVGPGTVYRHFPAKEALFEAVVTARITDLLLSCRVLKRTVEDAVLAFVTEQARARGAKQIEGHFRPTRKNAQVSAFYADRGFRAAGEEGDRRRFIAEVDAVPAVPPWIVIADLCARQAE